MNHRKEFQSRQEGQQTQSTQQGLTRETTREFAHADELLRHDSLHTPVPPNLAFRLAESIGPAPAKPRPWWRRLFGL